MRAKLYCGVTALLAAIVLFCLPPARAASGVTVGVEAWNAQVRGDIYKPRYAAITLADDLDMSRHWNPDFILAIATPGWWPDIRLEYGLMQSNGLATLTLPACFLGYTLQGTIRSQVAIKQGRILFAWHPLDNSVVDLKTGMDLRWVSLNLPASADVGIADCTTSTTVSPTAHFSTSAGVVSWLPEANLGLTVHLPAHFDVFFTGSGLPYASNYIYDLRTGVRYTFASGLILAVGYRRWRLHLDDKSLSVNGTIDFKGPFAGIYYHF